MKNKNKIENDVKNNREASKIIDAGEIIDRLKEVLNIKTDTGLCKAIGMSIANTTVWRRRNSINLSMIIEKFPDLDYNYIIKGELPEIPVMNRIQTAIVDSHYIDTMVKLGEALVAVTKAVSIEQGQANATNTM